MNRDDEELARLWEDFHALVTMSSPELREWLMSTPDGVDAYAPEPDIDPHALGLQVLQVLDKRRTDLTPSDLSLMREVVELIRGLLRNAPPDDVANGPWRDSLLTLGHDPSRADSPRGIDVSA